MRLESERMSAHAVEEPAVVRDDHRAARKVLQRLLERAQRLDVEVVRRLVEQQQVAALAQRLGEVDAPALAWAPTRTKLSRLPLGAAASRALRARPAPGRIPTLRGLPGRAGVASVPSGFHPRGAPPLSMAIFFSCTVPLRLKVETYARTAT